MKVFLSWSGDTSKALATALHDWLPMIFSDVSLWISTREIEAGERWGKQLDDQLESTNFGILCLVPTNVGSPWLIFEAGALSKSVDSSRVVPYCLGLEPKEIQGPLSRFQAVSADEAGSLKLVKSINSLVPGKRLDSVLEKIFDRLWPDLKRELEKIPTSGFHGPLVRVERILCASTPQFEALGAAEDMSLIEANYPNCVTRIHNVRASDLGSALARNRFDIVHLLGYVDPRTADFLFAENERLSALGLRTLIEQTGASLLFLATCDSLDLGSIVSRKVSVIAAVGTVDAEKMIMWERCFYGQLATGVSLAASYDFAQATRDLPMRLLIRNDACFLRSGVSTP